MLSIKSLLCCRWLSLQKLIIKKVDTLQRDQRWKINLPKDSSLVWSKSKKVKLSFLRYVDSMISKRPHFSMEKTIQGHEAQWANKTSKLTTLVTKILLDKAMLRRCARTKDTAHQALKFLSDTLAGQYAVLPRRLCHFLASIGVPVGIREETKDTIRLQQQS